jgi:hypothetical protein
MESFKIGKVSDEFWDLDQAGAVIKFQAPESAKTSKLVRKESQSLAKPQIKDSKYFATSNAARDFSERLALHADKLLEHRKMTNVFWK